MFYKHLLFYSWLNQNHARKRTNAAHVQKPFFRFLPVFIFSSTDVISCLQIVFIGEIFVAEVKKHVRPGMLFPIVPVVYYNNNAVSWRFSSKLERHLYLSYINWNCVFYWRQHTIFFGLRYLRVCFPWPVSKFKKCTVCHSGKGLLGIIKSAKYFSCELKQFAIYRVYHSTFPALRFQSHG